MRLKGQAGFTLIEMLMVIMLVAILAAVAIPQFVDFRTEAKNGATQSALGAMRTGIATQYGQMILRCNTLSGTWPTAANLQANDVTAGAGAACTAAQVTSAAERQFVPGTEMPENPWSLSTAHADKVAVTACAGNGCLQDGTVSCDGTAWGAATTSGWCYNPATGKVWANSNRNGGSVANNDIEFKF